MNLKQMKIILDGAPDWAKCWNTRMGCYTRGNIKDSSNIYLDGLRSQIVKHDTLDLEPTDIPHGTIVIDK